MGDLGPVTLNFAEATMDFDMGNKRVELEGLNMS